MRITILGHASVLIEQGDDRLLVDPVFAPTFASGAIGFHPDRIVDEEAMPRPTALLITHEHLDHWHAPTVARFDRRTPVYVPDDAWLRRRLTELGFTEQVTLAPWEAVRIGSVELLPTPSDTNVDEYGFVVRGAAGTYWHMSDCYAHGADAERILERWGPVTVVAARYQAGNGLVSHQRNLGGAHDERDLVVEWLEAACAAEPQLVFPYFWGVAYRGEHAWANRYAAPFSPSAIAGLLRRRLSPGRVAEVSPGDVIELIDGAAEHRPGGAAFVTAIASEAEGWEPVDVTTLAGVAPAERDELRRRLEDWFRATFGPWLSAGGGALEPLRAWQVRWQLVVHTGDGERLCYRIDFGRPEPMLRSGVDEDATLVVHVAGRALLAMLRGEAGSDLFWMAGAARVSERIIFLEDGHLAVPPLHGWDLHEAVPEPFTWCWRSTEREPRG